MKRDKFGRRVNLYAFTWCLITLIPSFVLLGKSGDVSTFSKSMVGYAIIGVVAIIFGIILWGRWIHKHITWLDRDEWLKGKSFVCLMVSAVLFWNVILFMVICSL